MNKEMRKVDEEMNIGRIEGEKLIAWILELYKDCQTKGNNGIV